MDMKRKIAFDILVSGTCAILGIAFVLAHSTRNFNISRGDNTPYVLSFNSNNRINESDYYLSNLSTNTDVYTTNNNLIRLSYKDVVTYENGWQTILPGGYILNKYVSSFENKNKLSGLQSIKYTGTGSLSLYYGYNENGITNIYSTEKELTNGVEYMFTNDTPSYFYIKNNNSTSININTLTIKYSCTEQLYPRNNLNVLMIGNSFADDTIKFTKNIASTNYGININVYDAYIASCTIDIHYGNLVNNPDNAAYTMNCSDGPSQSNKTLTQILNYASWDIITFQQASAEVGRPTSYTNLANLVNAVRNIVGDHPKFYWYQTWAYDHDYMEYYDYFSYFNNNEQTMFNAIINCYQNQVAPLGLFEDMIPGGTVVQNLRTSYLKETFTRDGKHMSSVQGRYLLGVNFLSHILDIDFSFDDYPYQYFPAGMNSSFKKVVCESVDNGWKVPLAVTPSTYLDPPEMVDYDLSTYTEIDSGLVGNTYYETLNETNYFNRMGNVVGTSNYYVTTKKFTSSTLPIGSLVFCPEGFGFRADFWESEAPASYKASDSYVNVLQIDSSFWNGYLYRAFTIFKAGKTELKGQFHQIFDGFRIFVPTNSLTNDMVIKNENTHYSQDSTLFTNEGKDIDSYTRLFIDPIIGFYKCDSYYDLTNSYNDDTAKKFICTRPFFTADGDLPEGTIIICDSAYQWRSDCWGSNGTYSPRPGNVSTNFFLVSASFMNNYRIRTFNFSKTNGGYVGQNATDFANHIRIYIPN